MKQCRNLVANEILDLAWYMEQIALELSELEI